MGKPYDQEMQALPKTLEWARGTNIEAFLGSVRTASTGPLVAVGSGGSLSTAYALAHAHQVATGQVASVLTPMEASATRLDPSTAIWLLSASGNNVDVVSAARSIAPREPRQVVALLGRKGSKVERVASTHPYIDCHIFAPPTGKDGFLATNSLFGSAALITRAFSAATSSGENPLASPHLTALVEHTSAVVEDWMEQVAPTLERDNLVVLHGPASALGAIDLESKFTEAALGQVQLADYRNFAHGRHHWLAKRGKTSAVLAFISDEDTDIASRTLSLIPAEVPVARVHLPGSTLGITLASLLAAFRITQWAGKHIGIDPGRPGVPEFGRKLYHLRPSQPKPEARAAKTTTRQVTAIQRKTGRSLEALTQSGEWEMWRTCLRRFEHELSTARFGAVVVDYDGTVVDTRHRFDPPSNEMASELTRLLDLGLMIGVATGRGKSVRVALRKVIPEKHWGRVIIGYYNGAALGPLGDEQTPQAAAPTCEIVQAAEKLREHPAILTHGTIELREHQLTLTGDRALSEQQLWEIAHGVTRGLEGVFSVARSSHSVDILDDFASKLRVGEQLRARGMSQDILSIGDRGRWPGNDHEFLAQPLSLSVDECSVDPSTCWNLAPAGHRGVAATLHALRSLHPLADGTVVWR